MLSDLRFAFRQLLKSPGFTLVAVLTLALGIGANTAIFSFINGVLLKPFPHSNPERIVCVFEKRPDGGNNSVSTLNYLDWESQNSVFEYIAARVGDSAALTGVDEPVQLRSARVSAHYFDVFGTVAELGRTFATGEDKAGKDHVVVLNHTFWESQFGADRQVLGRSIQLDGESYTVIGVLPKKQSSGFGGTQLWRPLSIALENRTRDYHWLSVVARLNAEVTLDRARAQMDAIGARIAHDFPDSNKGWGISLDRLGDVIVGDSLRQSLYLLLAAVSMVLLIACANVANLTLARNMAREREVSIRASLGASRCLLVRQFVIESLAVSFIGGAFGLAIGYATTVALNAKLPPYFLPSEASVTMDGHVLAFSLILTLLTGVLCGLIPAIQSTRLDLLHAMNQGGPNFSTSRHRNRIRSALVVSEVALAFVLLTSAGLLIRSFSTLQKIEVGMEPGNLLTADLPIPKNHFANTTEFSAYLRRIQDSLGALPGVLDVALTSALPMTGWGYGMRFQILGHASVDRAQRDNCFFKMVTPSYFRIVGIKLIKGRTFADSDVKGAPPVAVINETMARKYFPNEEPIGKRILIQEISFGKPQLGPEIPWEIVGIVADERIGSLDDRDRPFGAYVTQEQSPQTYQSVIVRAAIDPALLQKSISTAIQAINKDQPLANIKTLEQLKIESLGDSRLRALLLGIFAGVALLLSAIGIYGIISYSVAQRTREIGIRTALGAGPGKILALVIRNGMKLVAIGLALGVIGTYAFTKLLSSLLFGVGGRDPATIASVAAILSTVALLACWLPARRATKVNPIEALRAE